MKKLPANMLRTIQGMRIIMKKIYLMRHSIPERLKIETSKIPLSAQGVEAARQKRADFNNIDYFTLQPFVRIS